MSLSFEERERLKRREHFAHKLARLLADEADSLSEEIDQKKQKLGNNPENQELDLVNQFVGIYNTIIPIIRYLNQRFLRTETLYDPSSPQAKYRGPVSPSSHQTEWQKKEYVGTTQEQEKYKLAHFLNESVTEIETTACVQATDAERNTDNVYDQIIEDVNHFVDQYSENSPVS